MHQPSLFQGDAGGMSRDEDTPTRKFLRVEASAAAGLENRLDCILGA